MLDGYEEIWEMAEKLGLPQKPLWWDVNGCPRWKDPKEELRKFVKLIKCQYCGQEMPTCLVDDVYRCYGKTFVDHVFFSGKLPRDWHYGDPPSHPRPDQWGPKWWNGGWDAVCTGVTMNSIPQPEFECWEWSSGFPQYKKEFLAENDKEE